MSTGFWINGVRVADHTYRITTPLQRWAKVQAVGAAARHLRAWVDREHDERPTRDELREWVRLVLDDRAALAERPTVAEHDALRAHYERQTKVVSDLIGERDGALREVRVLTGQLVARASELAKVRRQLDEMRTAYEAAEDERNELARALRAVQGVATSDVDV